MAKLIDLTGQKIDKLLVLEKAPSRARHVYWKCKCDCGNECEISSESLRRQNISHNCGICELEKTKKEIRKKEKTTYLIGKKFGKLTVINSTEERINNSIVWHCKCECGNEKNVPTHLLTSGHTKSCGCLIREKQGIDITNQKFGKLTALFPCNFKKENRGTILWHCKCECGYEIDVDGSNLRRGLTKSCGCINYSIGELNIKNILIENNIMFKQEYTEFSLNLKRFDFALFNKNNEIIRLIEFDGEQHFNQNRGTWQNHESLEIIQQRDKIKNEWAAAHNIPLVRIPYWERDNITLEMILGDKYLVE